MSAVATATATWLVPKGGNDSHWRAEFPAEVIGGKVIDLPEKELDHVFLHPNHDTPFPWSLSAVDDDGQMFELRSKGDWDLFNAKPRKLATLFKPDFPELEGAAIFVRPCLARAVLAKAMRMQGIRTIAETDDNYFAHWNQNIFTRQGEAENPGAAKLMWDQHAKAYASMEVNVFSTARLRDRYHGEYRRRFGDVGLPELHVCRNHIPSWAWPEIPDHDGPLRVGFMGSPSHLWDIHIAYAAFHAAQYNGARTVMVGYNPGNPDPNIPETYTAEDGTFYQIKTKKSLRVSAKWAKVIDEHVGWVRPSDYHRAPLPLDIGLAPLRKNDFTLGKSDVKAIEYTISGAVSVLMRHPIYTAEGWKHEENCLLAKSQEDMGIQTLRLLRDRGLRRSLLAAAREKVRDERNEHVMRKEWLAAIG